MLSSHQQTIFRVWTSSRLLCMFLVYSIIRLFAQSGSHRRTCTWSRAQSHRDVIVLMRYLVLPRNPVDLPKFLTQAELNRCRDWIMDTYAFDRQLQLRNRAIFEVLWNGALRKGSLLGLQMKNINWMEGTMLVCRMMRKTTKRPGIARAAITARQKRASIWLLFQIRPSNGLTAIDKRLDP